MNGLSSPAFLAALALFFASGAQAAQSDEATLRAGRNIASTSCVACHVVSETQTVKPVLGPGIPSFQEIAARPGVSAEALDASMKEKRWHDCAIPFERAHFLDGFGTPDEMTALTASLPSATLHLCDQGDHSLIAPKKADPRGRLLEDAMDVAATWANNTVDRTRL